MKEVDQRERQMRGDSRPNVQAAKRCKWHDFSGSCRLNRSSDLDFGALVGDGVLAELPMGSCVCAWRCISTSCTWNWLLLI